MPPLAYAREHSLNNFAMKRVTKQLLSILLTVALALPLMSAQAATFPDVPATNSAYKAIEYFAQLGVIEGYTDTNTGIKYFKPTQAVNRAEAVKMLLAGSTQSYNIASSVTSNVFPDVKPGDWFAPYVGAAKTAGIVKGNDGTGLFDPARTVNKAELMKMVIMANGIDLSSELTDVRKEDIVDVRPSDWFYDYMRYGKAFGIIFPDSLGRLDPGKNLTRAEVAEILYNTVKIKKGGEIQQLLSRTEASIISAITAINAKQYDTALADIEDAKRYAEKAQSIEPNEPLVQEAYTIAQSYAVALQGYVAWKRDNKPATAKASALEAERLLTGISQLSELKASLTSLIEQLKNAA